MSFIRRYRPTVETLETSAEQAWSRHIVKMVKLHQLLEWDGENRGSEDPEYQDYGYPADPGSCLRTQRDQMSRYLDNILPLHIQETIFNKVLSILSRDTSEKNKHTNFLDSGSCPNARVLFITIFYKTKFKSLELSSCCGEQKSVAHILQAFNTNDTTTNNNILQENAKSLIAVRVKLFSRVHLSIEESYSLKQFLRTLVFLKNLTLWYVTDDSILHIIKETCPGLESIDVWKSSRVTDRGIQQFLHPYNSQIKRLLVKETSLTTTGLLTVLQLATKLEHLEFSKGEVATTFWGVLSEHYETTRDTFSIQAIFLPVNNIDILERVVKSLPLLQKLSIWTGLKSIPASWNYDDLHELRHLQLGGLQGQPFLTQILKLVGRNLRSLELNSVHFTVDISLVGSECSNLEELRVFSSKVQIGTEVQTSQNSQPRSQVNCQESQQRSQISQASPDTIQTKKSHEAFPFSKIRSLQLFLLETQGEDSVLEYILLRSPLLCNLQVTGKDSLNHEMLTNILAVNPLKNLRRLMISVPLLEEGGARPDQAAGEEHQMNSMTRSKLDLGLHSISRILESCPNIQSIGDLRSWSIERSERGSLSSLCIKQRFCV